MDNLVMIKQNIEHMNSLTGFDVIIVCCSSGLQADYWQKRLEKGKGSVVPSSSVVVAVEEDWPGGAGNALGTLYAYQKACKFSLNKFGVDIAAGLSSNLFSVGLYHTAGKGTRLAPLPGAENNNKPGVKLPASVSLGGQSTPITILEAVIKQTGSYAKSRLGRLSVFWGDQIFIPTVSVEYTVTHHVDILCSLGPMPSEIEWSEKGLDKYGLIARSATGGAAQVEKVDHATAVKLLADLGEIEAVGASLGSFSISSLMLRALINEFAGELAAKKGKFDSDPHLWMPMTLNKEAYQHLMGQKGVSTAVSGLHFERISEMMQKFHEQEAASTLGLFGPVDVGQGVYWWDYGQLKLFQKNTLLMVDGSQEAEMMKLFFGVSGSTVASSVGPDVTIRGNSSISSSHVSSGSITGSTLNNVRCRHIEAENAILINVTADSIIARNGSIVYNIVDDKSIGLNLVEGEVRAGVFQADSSQIVIRSNVSIDGGKAWETKVESNDLSFEEVYNLNAEVCPSTLEKLIAEIHQSTWSKIDTNK